MQFNSKIFKELSVNEIYEILKAREIIFLLEQNIICQDIDDKDKESLHCFLNDGDNLVAYLRAYECEEGIAIGRVLTLEHKKGLGRELILKSVDAIKKTF